MIDRVACPDCERVHAVLHLEPGRAVVRCTHCERLWAASFAGQSDTPELFHCSEHRGRKTVALCSQCDHPWCESCTKVTKVQGFKTTLSPCCREGLDPVASMTPLHPFWSDLPAVALYILRGSGLYMLLFFWFVSLLPLMGFFVQVLALAYGVHVLRESAGGPGRAPEFPDIGDGFSGLVSPALRVLGAGVVAMSPYFMLTAYGSGIQLALLEPFLLVGGLLIFPAILLLSACTRSFSAALSPVKLFTTMRGMGLDYLVLVLVVLLFFVVAFFARQVPLLGGLFFFYLLLTLFHIIGLTVWQSRDRIDWEI